MSEDIKQNVNTNSTEFNEGVEAGLNSTEDTKNWKAGNALGQALKEEADPEKPINEIPVREPSIPLFMSGGTGGRMGDAQDEKDEKGE